MFAFSGELNKYSTLEVFDCSHNLLTSLRNSLFNVSAPFLRNLHFQFNAIRSISKEAFLGMYVLLQEFLQLQKSISWQILRKHFSSKEFVKRGDDWRQSPSETRPTVSFLS